MGQCHRRRAELCRISDGEVDLMLCRDTTLEGDAVRLGDGIAVAVFDEVEPLFLPQRSLEVRGLADQTRLPLFANASPK